MPRKRNKPKKSSESSVGRALINDINRRNRGRRKVSDNSMLHTTELEDGQDWGRLNLQSVTEQSSLQEFLATAELAGKEFQAEKLNIRIINPLTEGLLTKDQLKKASDAHVTFKESLKIPRRPQWTRDMSRSELDRIERESFLDWRRNLSKLQEEQNLLLTPYETNLEFWRQLWRVIERSDVIVQIVDARNPLLFRCEDLENYVKEVSQDKKNLILINKADFLNDVQRKEWANYFQSIELQAVFFSAKPDDGKIEEENEETNDTKEQQDPAQAEENEEEEESDSGENETKVKNADALKSDIHKLEQSVNQNEKVLDTLLTRIEKLMGPTDLRAEVEAMVVNSPKILTREELIQLFKTIHKGPKVTENITTIGLVGYPNVGKSSTINTLLLATKVRVSATPGKTKHFQTLYLDKDLLLCDCPGLVMPSFVFTKAEMILNGILPIDQMKHHVPPVNLLTKLIPKHILEDMYGIMLPKPLEGEDPDRSPTSEELLNAYAYNRGYMTANGQPDNPRAARYVLKDYVNGRLLYCYAPPNVDQKLYHTWPERQKTKLQERVQTPREARAVRTLKVTGEDIDRKFFLDQSQVHAKNSRGIDANTISQGEASGVEKPWKLINKHRNKNKKEKLRRTYAHLDQV